MAEEDKKPNLKDEKVIGNGSFGVVFQATMADTGEIVAVKKVLQDKRFKNREFQIMKQLRHVNIVELKNCFYTNGEKPEEVYLNLLLEFVPETIYRIIRHYSRSSRLVPPVLAKLYMYQVARSLAYIHEGGVCHRDIKPQNLLLDPNSHVVKLCDFGSAKMLVPGENNIAYICSRYYRAPELILGCTDYTTAIDTWSYGCVFAELLLCQPLFPGESNVDQLVEIIRIKGTPTKDEMLCMNCNLAEFNFPKIPDHTWQNVFRSRATPDCLDLIANIITYNPTKRLTPMQCCAHPYYDELRDPSTVLPDGRPLPTSILFNFTPEEIRAAGDLYHKLSPNPVSSHSGQHQQMQPQQQYGVKPMRPSGLPVTEYHPDFPPQPLSFDNKQLTANADFSSAQRPAAPSSNSLQQPTPPTPPGSGAPQQPSQTPQALMPESGYKQDDNPGALVEPSSTFQSQARAASPSPTNNPEFQPATESSYAPLSGSSALGYQVPGYRPQSSLRQDGPSMAFRPEDLSQQDQGASGQWQPSRPQAANPGHGPPQSLPQPHQAPMQQLRQPGSQPQQISMQQTIGC
eukprot:Tamp_09816.p1 GENE.Tamp_09816~~Tamp_09816.p1  ORF type:complete len:634 (+),score=94.30 Tamp_09816:190-1902(+)